MDGAIIFSDILVVPHALGAEVRFEEGVGPVLSPIRTEEQLKKLSDKKLSEHLAPVYQALRLTKAALPKETALIGFVGAPWTLACYMVEGGSSKQFDTIRTLCAEDEAFFSSLILLLTDAVTKHALAQIEAGAEIIQIFDSWSGLLSDEPYRKWVIEPTRHIVASIKKRYPDVPVIGFPRQSGIKYAAYVRETGVDGLSFDQSVPLDWAKQEVGKTCVLQGCLNQQLLADDMPAMLEETRHILLTLDKPFIFNLSHGILPHTPIKHMEALCQLLKSA